MLQVNVGALWDPDLNSLLDKYLKVGLLDHIVVLLFIIISFSEYIWFLKKFFIEM